MRKFQTEGVKSLHHGPYLNRRAKDTIRYMQSDTGIIVEGFLFRTLKDIGYDLNPEKDNKSQYDPQAMFTALERYIQGPRPIYDLEVWNQAYSLTMRAFVGEFRNTVEPNWDKDYLRSATKVNKSSGAPDFTTKGEAFERDYARMNRWISGQKAPDPCTCYHRVQHGVEGPKNRMVWGYPQSVTIAEAAFARPLIEHFKGVRNPMAMGRRRVKVAAKLAQIQNCYYKYGLDFSKFDSSVSAKLVRMAFMILQNLLDLSESDLRAFLKVEGYFINTPILMPDGEIYKKKKGVPSGSYFTQMIDSIINYFVTQYVVIKLHGEAIRDDYICVLGDDSMFSYPKRLEKDDLVREFEAIGMHLNPEKSEFSFGGRRMHFLGHEWKHGIVDRDPVDIAKRIAFPEKPSKEKDGRIRSQDRMFAYVTDALSSHKVISEYSYAGGDPIRTYGPHKLTNTSITGWMEYRATNEDDEMLKDAYFLALNGILK